MRVPPGSAWHEPFWRAASAVQCSDDNLPEPLVFLHGLDDGVVLAAGARQSTRALGTHPIGPGVRGVSD